MQQQRKGLVRRFFAALWGGIGWLRVSLANLLFILLILLVIVTLSAEQKPRIPDRAALVLSLSGRVVEQLSFVDPLAHLLGGDRERERETLLKDVIDALTRAKDDPRIEVVVLALDGMEGAGITKSGDIAMALESVRASGKKIIAVGDSYSQDQYLLAAQADEIWMHPMGGVELTGLGFFRNYYAQALQKLKVDLHVFRSGTYKSAYEFLERSDMSDADRLASGELLQELWSAYTAAVTGRRNLPAESVDHFANEIDTIFATHGGDAAAVALEYGFVDALKSRQEMDEALTELVGEAEEGGFSGVDFRDYLAETDEPSLSPDGKVRKEIGVIVASGMILDGEQPAGNVGGDSLAALIREAGEDEDVKALVLRIDSPGGSAFASEIIREALLDFRASGKPLVASMGSVAASGGYWIAAPADEIWASATTITGSIGVLSAFPSFSRALESLGVHNDGVGTTAVAGGFDVSRPLSDKVKVVLGLSNQHMYERFIAIVAEGRNMDRERVAELAEGRVWTGAQAASNGLVDHLGDIEEATVAAARLAKLEHYQVHYFEQTPSWQEQVLMRLSLAPSGILQQLLSQQQSGLRQLGQALEIATKLNDPRGLYALCLGCSAP